MPEAAQPMLPAGTRLGMHEVVRRLAVGGMGEVYLGHSVDGSDVVVIKTIRPSLAADPDFERMFLREARMSANVDHPRLVKVIDSGRCDGIVYMTLEYVHGVDLRTLLDACGSGPLPVPCVLAIGMGTAEGLHAAHEARDEEGKPQRLVHRDVSPSNLLIAADGQVKVTDFGIAAGCDATDPTSTAHARGKVDYMSPEQAGCRPIDRRSDLFSLGIVLYQLVTGELPFAAASASAVLRRISRGDYEPPSNIADVPLELERVIRRALRVDPDQRFSSAAELHAALCDAGRALGVAASPAVLAALLKDKVGERL